MGRKQREGGAVRLPRVYEGEAVLASLLKAAASSRPVAEVKERIARGIAERRRPGEVFPALFDGEPHFDSPDTALRLYANLFGLWERIEAGREVEPRGTPQPETAAREPAPAPKPPGEGPLPEDFVEAAWRHLDDLPEREAQRLRHRFENTQPELTEYLQVNAADSASAFDTADALAFELWAMLDLARPGHRRRAVTLKELAAAEGQEAGLEPGLEQYVEDALAEAALDDEAPLGAEDAVRVRRIARAVIAALRQE